MKLHFAFLSASAIAAACGTSGSTDAVVLGAGSSAAQTSSSASSGAVGAGSGGATSGASSATAGSASSAATTGSGGASGYVIDLSQTSTSGLSSGGFMAVQFHVAFSSIMKGAAIFAGGPYQCALGTLAGAELDCSDAAFAPNVAPLVAITKQYATAGDIDDPKNLAGQRVFLFGGIDDFTVSPVVMDSLNTYYQAFLSAKDIQYVSRRLGTGHTMPTLDYGIACAFSASPYVGDCGYDGAGVALAQIYGALEPASVNPSGKFLSLAQADFIANPASHSLADTGYAYVPTSCVNGETCRIHVAFHGCAQEASGAAGDAYYKHAGYNAWADSNHVIILYPQTIASNFPSNPNACWDWWGYDSPDYSKKSGPQMAMVRAMIEHFAGQ